MYITEIQIKDLVNFQGDHKVSFPVTEEGIPNDLYVLVGQNNSGKSSLLQLARACTDTDYLKEQWEKNINLSKKRLSEEKPNGIVICKMKVSVEKEITAAFYKTQNCGVYAWAESDKDVPCFIFMKLTEGETEALYSVEPKDEGPASGFSVEPNYMTRMTTKLSTALKNQWKTKEELGWDRLPWERMIQPLVIQSDSQSIRQDVIEAWGKLKPQVKKDVIDFIKRIGYEHYEVSKIETGDMVFTDTNTGLAFDINRLPDGHQYLWRMAIQMSRCRLRNENTKCLIIDEPTRSMHPSLVHHLSAEMREYCQKHEVQFIITSHSPAVVRALRLSNVFLATRMQDGTTNIRALIGTKSSEQGEQHAKFVIERNIEDILFARIVMIVEGETDRRLFSMLLSKLSRLQEADLCKALGIVPDQRSCTATKPSDQRLIKFRSLLRDIIVVAARGKNIVAHFLSHLDFLGIPYFMVVDGDVVWPTQESSAKRAKKAKKSLVKRSPAEVSVENLLEKDLMQNLFKGSDMLRDEILLNELKTLFQGSTGVVSGPTMSFGDAKKIHDTHKEGKCGCTNRVCLEAVDNSLEAGRRSLVNERLKCVVKCTFGIKLSQEEKQKLTDEEMKELGGVDLADEETRKMANKRWETLVEKDRKSMTNQDNKILFRRYTKLLQHWFRLFLWRRVEPFDLESVVKPVICKVAQLSDAPGTMGDLEQLDSSYSKMTTLVQKRKTSTITQDSEDSFRKEIKQRMNDTLGTMTDMRDRKELLYFGLTGLTHREMTTLVDEMVKGVITPEDFAEEFTESRTKINGKLKAKLAHGFTAGEMVALVDEMIQGIKDNTTQDLRDFLVFLEIRVLPYYAQHGKVRKLKLIDSSIGKDPKDRMKDINIEKGAKYLEVKCKLEDEDDRREIET